MERNSLLRSTSITNPFYNTDENSQINQENQTEESKYLKKLNFKLKLGLILFGIGFLVIIIIMIVALVRADSTLSQIEAINLTSIEETAMSLNQILANNGTEKIILFLDSIDPDTITLYLLKIKNIVDEACHYFFRC